MSFAFAVVRPGSEAWAKEEVARARPGWRFAYGRPGLVTWRRDDAGDAGREAAETVVARVWGRGVGAVESVEEVLRIAREEAREGALVLHAFARGRRGEEEERDEDRARAARVEAALRAGGGETFAGEARAAEGARVLDVIVGAGDGSDEDELYVGVHVQRAGAIAWPGGRIPIDVPDDAPSRAYRKIEEMIAWSGLAVREGDVAVELGAAPGGAAYALARRGVSVVGIDPAAIDPRVLAYEGPGGARVTHLAEAAGAVAPDELPRGARWLLCDLNLAPPVALRYAARIARALGGSLEGAVITLKMNDARMIASIPSLLERARALVPGAEAARAIQLPAHRREIGAAVIRSRRGAGDRAGRGPRAGARARAPRTR